MLRNLTQTPETSILEEICSPGVIYIVISRMWNLMLLMRLYGQFMIEVFLEAICQAIVLTAHTLDGWSGIGCKSRPNPI